MERIPCLILASYIIQLVGVVLTIVSIATVDWTLLTNVFNKEAKFGLWQFCLDNLCQGYSTDNETRGYIFRLRVCEFMGILSTLTCVLNLFLSVYYFQYMLPRGLTNRFIKPSGIAGDGFGSALMMLVCVVVWGTDIHNELSSQQSPNLGYSFWLAVVGQVLVAAGGLLFLRGVRRFQAQTTLQAYLDGLTYQQQEQIPILAVK